MRLNQAGDTIVEVLMCIAIISAVVGGAYTITDKNVKNTQQAQEHSQALKVAETQIEQLKSYLAVGNGNTVSALPANENFCMYLTSSPTQTLALKDIGNTNPLPLTSYPTECKKDDNGVSQRYGVAIKQSSNVFTVNVSWVGPTSGQDQVSLSYRLYP